MPDRTKHPRACYIPGAGGKDEIYERQWEVLRQLGPQFIFVRPNFCHYNTRNSLVKRGWIEVRKRREYWMVRLTRAALPKLSLGSKGSTLGVNLRLRR